MSRPVLTSHVLLRLLLAVVFLPHALGKLQYHSTFGAKFGLSETVTLATGIAELLAVIGAVVGLALIAGYGPGGRWRPHLAWVTTALTALSIWIVQVGAIAVARWPNWLDYNSGAEYNVALLVVALVMLLLTPWPWRDNRAPRKGLA